MDRSASNDRRRRLAKAFGGFSAVFGGLRRLSGAPGAPGGSPEAPRGPRRFSFFHGFFVDFRFFVDVLIFSIRGPRRSRTFHQDRFFILNRFLTVLAPVEGLLRPRTVKNLRRDFFTTSEIWGDRGADGERLLRGPCRPKLLPRILWNAARTGFSRAVSGRGGAGPSGGLGEESEEEDPPRSPTT